MTREEAQAVIMNEQKCIDRADRCNRDCGNCDLVMDEKIINEAYNFAIKALEQPERKTGEWIDGKRMKNDGTFYWFRQCDQCGYERNDCDAEKDSNFCPDCGADMRQIGGQDGER